jgi:hypothetical protein
MFATGADRSAGIGSYLEISSRVTVWARLRSRTLARGREAILGPQTGGSGYGAGVATSEANAAGGDRLPADVLEAIAYPEGGRVVLVIGAGCSVDAPTNLPLAGALARECHRRLVEDGVIAQDACDSPDDLSAVADAVFAATNSQRALVERFPPDRFRRAAPNEGHRIAAALMREGAISNIVSLNFDLAEDAALTNVSAGAEVATISGPEEHHRLIAQNLI